MGGEYEFYRNVQAETQDATAAEMDRMRKRWELEFGQMRNAQSKLDNTLQRHARVMSAQERRWNRRYQMVLKAAENALRLLALCLLLVALMAVGGIANAPLVRAATCFLVTAAATLGAVWAAVVAENVHELREQ